MSISSDTTYECGFDGELGSIMSVDAHGHLDFSDAEVFLADVVARELHDGGFDEGPNFGLEIEHLWRTEHPLAIEDDEDSEYGERWTYSYTENERPGAVAVTRFQVASPWARPAVSPTADRATTDRRTHKFTVEGVDYFPLLCIHHPDEPAVTGIPVDRFIDPSPENVLDALVHYCGPCHTAFNERMRIATEKAWAPERTTEFLAATDDDDEVVAIAFGQPLRRTHLDAVLNGTDTDGSARRGLAAFAGSFRAASVKLRSPVAVAQPGYKVLMLSDIEHLVEGYSRA